MLHNVRRARLRRFCGEGGLCGVVAGGRHIYEKANLVPVLWQAWLAKTAIGVYVQYIETLKHCDTTTRF
jgi:hypothetical protein